MANLVADSMATQVTVLPDTLVLYVLYVPKPIVAAATFRTMITEGRTDELVESVSNLCSPGAASALFVTGEAGEFASAFMLMLACSHQPI